MTTIVSNLDEQVREAQMGNNVALENVVRAVQDYIHHLAMRILVRPEDAQDATQEILILVVTKLSTFKGESAFKTWVYRVATNYLLTAKKVAAKNCGVSFEAFAADLEKGLVQDPTPQADDVVMLNELRISCTMAMLLCLDMKHRIAYVLGDILEMEHLEAAKALNVSKENYRKRLSRARADVVDFTSSQCGLANSSAKCSCPKRLSVAKELGRVSAKTYTDKHSMSYQSVINSVKRVEGELKVLKLQNATPFFKSPTDLSAHIAQIVQGST